MASQFYKRYVPPPKVPNIEEQTSKHDDQVPPEGLNHLSKHVRKARDPDLKLSKKLNRGKKLVKRPLSKQVSTNIPTEISSPPPATARKPTEIDVIKSGVNQSVEKHGLTPIPQPTQSEEGPRISISSALPNWLRAPTVASTSTVTPFETFSKDGSMSEKLVSNLSRRHYSNANGLQGALLPMLLPEHRGPERYHGDICISAATGSGKTLAYALPLVEALSSRAVTRLRGLIVVPTRELVTQARETLEMCSAGMGIKIGTAVGNKKLKDEQYLLVEKGQRWDPDAYTAEQQREIDEDEELMNWDFDAVLGPQDEFECWPDHVIEYSSKIDILICTPGRLVEHIKCTKGFHLHHLQWLVIDEADRLLAESFQEWVDVVIPTLEYLPPLDALEQAFYKSSHIPHQREVRKIILSATMTRDVSKLLSLRLRRPRLVALEGLREKDGIDGREREDIFQDERIELPSMLQEVAMAVANVEDKPLYLLQLLNGTLEARVDQKDTKAAGEMNQQRSDDESDSSSDASGAVIQEKKTRTSGTLIFANSNESALRLGRLLTIMLPEQKIKALTKSPSDKGGRKTLQMFRRGELSVIIATDLASRGLDIPDLAHVINYDLPTSLKSYVHRVGRTARAGKEGRATTLVEHRQAKWFWNDIVRAKCIIRATRVARIDQELRVQEYERAKYVDALSSLEQDVMGIDIEEVKAEGKRDF